VKLVVERCKPSLLLIFPYIIVVATGTSNPEYKLYQLAMVIPFFNLATVLLTSQGNSITDFFQIYKSGKLQNKSKKGVFYSVSNVSVLPYTQNFRGQNTHSFCNYAANHKSFPYESSDCKN